MIKTYSQDDTRRFVGILTEAAKTEILPRFCHLQQDHVRHKNSARDLVTDADEAAERFIAVKLSKLHPGAVIVGEEGSTRNPALLNMLSTLSWPF